MAKVWLYQRNNNFVQETNRIFSSETGSLYFSFLRTTDAGKYACSLYDNNRNSGKLGPLFELKVTPSKGKVASAKPSIAAEFPRSVPDKPLFGQPLTIECFAYAKPSPKYTWSRMVNSKMVKLSSTTHRLHIAKLSLTDEGFYRCDAVNPYGNATKYIKVVVAIKPRWMTQRSTRVLHPGETFYMKPMPYSKPVEPVHCEWYRNGKPLNEWLLMPHESERIDIRKDSLVVRAVHNNDSGVYQCCWNTEDMASVWIAIELQVLDVSDITLPMQTVHGVEEESLTIECPIKSKHIKWTFNGARMYRDNKVFNEQFLTINKASVYDSGNYTCMDITSSYPNNTQTFVVKVARRLKLSLNHQGGYPLNARGEGYLKCRVDSGATGHEEVIMSWRFNGLLLEHARQTPRQLDDNWIPLRFTPDVSRAGKYVCRAETAHQASEASVNLNINDAPPPPYNVTVLRISNDYLMLQWLCQDDVVVNQVRIYHRGQHEEGFKFLEVLTNPSFPIGTQRIMEDSLTDSHYTLQQFRVSAYNQHGWSKPSTPSNWVRTRPSYPRRAPKGLQQNMLDSRVDRVVVQWEALPESQWAAPRLHYVVTWKDQKENTRGTVRVQGTTYSIPVTENDLFIRVSVGAENDMGRGPDSDPIEAYVYKAPVIDDLWIDARGMNESAIQLSIMTNNQRRQKGTLPTHLQITFYNASSGQPVLAVSHNLILPYRTLKKTVVGLQADTLYSLKAQAGNPAGRTPYQRYICVSTYKSAPLSAPDFAQASWHGESLVLRWSQVILGPKEERLQGFKAAVHSSRLSTHSHLVDLPSADVRPSNTYPQRYAVRLRGLTERLIHNLSLHAYNKGGLGPPVVPVFVPQDAVSINRSSKIFSGLHATFLLAIMMLLLIA